MASNMAAKVENPDVLAIYDFYWMQIELKTIDGVWVWQNTEIPQTTLTVSLVNPMADTARRV